MVWPALISAGAGLLGGYLQNRSQSAANSKSIAAQQAINDQQLAFANHLNRNRIQMTVEDAKKAGIHPLAALGASSVGGFASPVMQAPQYFGGRGIGAGLSAAAPFLGSLGDHFQADDEASPADREISPVEQAMIDEARSRTKLNNAMLWAREHPDLANPPKVVTMALPPPRGYSSSSSSFGPRTFRTTTGVEWRGTPRSSAQEMEDEYGQVIGEIHGIGSFLHDTWRNWDNTLPGFNYKRWKRGHPDERIFK